MRDLMLQFSNNIFIEILMLAICADTLLGVLRAIKFRQFNSSVGIDGAIRKVAMVVSVGILMLADLLIHVNLLAFIPEEYVHDLGVQKLGMCEFFCLLFTACECLSVLKNMVLCGLPVPKLFRSVPKKVESWMRDFLANMTSELSVDNGINDKIYEVGEANTNNGVLNKMKAGGGENVRQ